MFKLNKKKILEMTGEDFKNFCEHNSDSDGFCKKDCPLYNKLICQLLNRGLKDVRELDDNLKYVYNKTFGQLLKELEEFNDKKIVWLEK